MKTDRLFFFYLFLLLIICTQIPSFAGVGGIGGGPGVVALTIQDIDSHGRPIYLPGLYCNPGEDLQRCIMVSIRPSEAQYHTEIYRGVYLIDYVKHPDRLQIQTQWNSVRGSQSRQKRSVFGPPDGE